MFLDSFHLGIPTHDIKASVQFYERLGFEVINEEKKAAIPVVFLKSGNLLIESYQIAGPIANITGAIDHLCINTDDLETAYQTMKNYGYEFAQEEVEELPYWSNGIRFFKVYGPSREIVEICQIM